MGYVEDVYKSETFAILSLCLLFRVCSSYELKQNMAIINCSGRNVWVCTAEPTFAEKVYSTRGAKIPPAVSPWRLNYVQWRLIYVGPGFGTCFMSAFWRLEF